ncbi:hypothetical protein LOK49_LG08G01594 [Camellia lanceoleosa]|uniref:Uncharacterized protein n=1 Tax=Camellia lanceoleosa TaxID=1840588 RepID=A0ACC0GQC2_9ERIC|nr:hypothetical protein LOK49_LG08G01594 [Camellia lanceoleosa]
MRGFVCKIPSDHGLDGVGKVVSLGVGVFLGYVFSGWYIQMCKKLALEESRYIEMLEKQALEESRTAVVTC